MILDYLSSSALESALCALSNGGRIKNEDVVGWPTDIIRHLESLIPSTDLTSDGAQTRIRLLNIADSFHRYPMTSTTKRMEVIIDFLSLCSRDCPKAAEPQWGCVGAQLIAQVIVDVSKDTRKPIKDTLTQSIAQVDEAMRRDVSHKIIFNPSKWFQPTTAGTPLRDHIEKISRRLPPDQLRHELYSILLSLSKTHDPPVLIQLERGKLSGLSRAETLQLKTRLGIR